MKKRKLVVAQKGAMNYIIDKSNTSQPWICRHELADFFKWDSHDAGNLVSRLFRVGYKGKKVLEETRTGKTTCKSQPDRKHMHYVYIEEKEIPKSESTIPVSDETVKRLGEAAHEGESYNSVIARLFSKIRGLSQDRDNQVSVLQKYRKDIEILNKDKQTSRDVNEAKMVKVLADQMTTLVREFGKTKTSLDKQREINKILIQFMK